MVVGHGNSVLIANSASWCQEAAEAVALALSGHRIKADGSSELDLKSAGAGWSAVRRLTPASHVHHKVGRLASMAKSPLRWSGRTSRSTI